mmetsp:Transcript_20840/g.49407  ORF Transcript_20840/g.49407 Transcript_20840/m.49407 type:complete len:452 (-) Transcript_20840:329-1684(-)
MQFKDILHPLQLHVADHDILIHLLRQGCIRLDVAVPADPVFCPGLIDEVIAVALVRETDSFRDALHVAVEGLSVIDGFIVSHGAANRPHHGKAEEGIIAHLLVLWRHDPQSFHVLFGVVVQQSIHETRQAVDEAHVQHWAREAKRFADGFNVGLKVVGEVQVKGALWNCVHLLSPTLDIWLPANVRLVDEQHASTRDRCRARMLHVLDLKDHAHAWGERNTLVGHQRQDLVVIHHRVHGLNPRGINVTIQDHPLVLVRCLVAVHLFAHVSENHCNQTIFPLLRLGHCAVQLITGYCFGVRLLPLPILTPRAQGLHQRLPHLCLAASGWTNDEHAMAHAKDTQHTHDLDDELGIRLQAPLLGDVAAEFLKLGITEWVRPHSGKQIHDQAQEDGHVKSCDLRCVEIAERTTQHWILVTFGLQSLQSAGLSQERLHCSKAPIVMHLLAEQLLAQ